MGRTRQYMEKTIEQLENFGLSNYEARIYATLVAASPQSATHIAKICDLSRSSVYTTLSSLISKGLVSTTHKNEVKQFMAEDKSSLELMLKKEKRDLEQKFSAFDLLGKSLMAISSASSATDPLSMPNIQTFEGQEGLKKIYLSMMRQAPQGSTLHLIRDEFIWQPDWKFIFEHDWRIQAKRIKMGKAIKTKLLINDSPIERAQLSSYRSKKSLEFRLIPHSHKIKQFAMYILGDIVSILSMEKNNLVGIKITNRHLARNFIQIFDGLWEKGAGSVTSPLRSPKVKK